ncbi:Rz1 lytic protein [Salmonella enterica]|uniref:Rz1 lytic protein n=1 Tax=Salmonella enterica subsp. arizonae serovar 48:z4,z24:- TaxID=1967584 RepID=A0A739C126_SALER|nr:Rz1 lytic protein [Salmonella enterica]EDR1778289.1 Rz1 lytic protein [Salmonella enterica subsp. arizonae]EDU0935690.1 Rz1 lytic protein [Salmonella enterica subsp. arizonae serovar 48:z4,z24:-]EDX3025471.1 Rz1 lytic protein [Salmonella enterica subsp. houtenae serovar 48:g,z51:-]EAR4676556.1 Rz1 lytic protein [Salmonella enterica]
MQKTRSHWTHSEPRQISRWLLRMMIVLHVLCLLPLLTGCGSTRTVYVTTTVAPLPASLTAETLQPAIPDPLTYGGSLDLNVSLLSALATCNRDKAGIRRIEESQTTHQSKIIVPE